MTKEQIPIISSCAVFPCPVSADRITLVGLRLKRGTGVAMSLNDGKEDGPAIVLSRGTDVHSIDFDEVADWQPLPPVMLLASVITDIANDCERDQLAGHLLTNILSVAGSVLFELLLEDGGEETNNKVRVSITAGEFKIVTEADLADIIEFVGEDGTVPKPPATVPPPERVPHDPCANCNERLMGVGGEACQDCNLK